MHLGPVFAVLRQTETRNMVSHGLAPSTGYVPFEDARNIKFESNVAMLKIDKDLKMCTGERKQGIAFLTACYRDICLLLTHRSVIDVRLVIC